MQWSCVEAELMLLDHSGSHIHFLAFHCGFRVRQLYVVLAAYKCAVPPCGAAVEHTLWQLSDPVSRRAVYTVCSFVDPPPDHQYKPAISAIMCLEVAFWSLEQATPAFHVSSLVGPRTSLMKSAPAISGDLSL
jgi:hypothetical protein